MKRLFVLLGLFLLPSFAFAQSYESRCPAGYKAASFGVTRDLNTNKLREEVCVNNAGQMVWAGQAGGPLYATSFPGANIGAQVNAAVASIPAGIGATVMIPAGTFDFNTPIVLNKANIGLCGQGPGTTLNYTGGPGTFALTLGNGSPSTVRKYHLCDMTITGGGLGAVGVFVHRNISQATIIERLSVSGFATQIQVGEGLSSAYAGVIRDCELTVANGQIGIDLVFRAHAWTLTDNWIIGDFNPLSTGVGVKVRGSANVRLINNVIEGNTGDNVYLAVSGADPTQATYLAGNYFEGCALDVSVTAGVLNTIITGNYFFGNPTLCGGMAVTQVQMNAGSIGTWIAGNRMLLTTGAHITNNAGAGGNVWLGPNDTDGTLISSSVGVVSYLSNAGLSIGSAVGTYPLYINKSFPADFLAKFRNTSATGSGLVLVPGADTTYPGLSVKNAADAAQAFNIYGDGTIEWPSGRDFASLGAEANGRVVYCVDCTITSPCAGAGAGALAKRLNGAWECN